MGPQRFITVVQGVINDHDLFAGIQDLFIHIQPRMGTGLTGTVDPLDRVQLRNGQDLIQMGQFADAVQMVDRIGQPADILMQCRKDETAEHLRTQHIAEIALQDIGRIPAQQAIPVCVDPLGLQSFGKIVVRLIPGRLGLFHQPLHFLRLIHQSVEQILGTHHGGHHIHHTAQVRETHDHSAVPALQTRPVNILDPAAPDIVRIVLYMELAEIRILLRREEPDLAGAVIQFGAAESRHHTGTVEPEIHHRIAVADVLLGAKMTVHRIDDLFCRPGKIMAVGLAGNRRESPMRTGISIAHHAFDQGTVQLAPPPALMGIDNGLQAGSVKVNGHSSTSVIPAAYL